MTEEPTGLPPNQRLAAPGRWPVVGERAPREAESPSHPWSVSIEGLVERTLRIPLDDLRAMPRDTWTVDVHCVTRWSRPGMTFGGVPLRCLLTLAAPLPGARFLSFTARSTRDHSTSLPLDCADDILIAFDADGIPLSSEHGGPVRTVMRNRYFYKSLKWLERIDVLAEDRLGTWERESGYHNGADPWREERYMTPDLDRLEVARVLASRDMSGRSLRSLTAAGLDLEDLRAEGALLRDADFSRCRLARADFSDANLSNARFTGADLRGARLTRADLEGADFTDSDLRGADLRQTSLFGATFGPSNDAPPAPGDPHHARPARVDAQTLLPAGARDVLTASDLAAVHGAQFI